jgi:hypothetical protein
VIIEHGYSFDDDHICTLYIVSDGDGDYTQLPIIESDPLRFGAYGPCPYITSKQMSFIRRRIVERTLRCSPSIRHLFGFRFLLKGNNYNDICLLNYQSTFEEPESEVLLSLCDADIFLQYALDLPSVSITNKKRRIHCVNTTIISKKDSVIIPNKVLLTALKNNKVKIFHNQTDVNTIGGETGTITTNGERIFNVLGFGSTLQEAQIQSILACEYIKQHTNNDELSFKTDIGSEAIEWYKTHGDHQNGLTNGKRKKINMKVHQNTKNSDDEETSDDEKNEPMDFERAFGSTADIPKLEHLDIHQNNGILNTFEGDSFFDFSTKIDLKNFNQPVLVSSTINLNPLAAVSLFFFK